MTDDTLDILGLTSTDHVADAARRGIASDAAIAAYRDVFRAGAELPGAPSIVDERRDGDTIKFLLQLPDDLQTETVIIPGTGSSGRERNTLCVSSQVGCAMGCTFCETARMGLMRNLPASLIVAQWRAAAHALGRPISNVVFMGMGEPMDNLDAVLQAIRVFADRNGPGIAASRITVSTVGLVAGIDRLTAFSREPGFRQVRLAVSVNAPDDAIRGELMPVNRAAPMAALRDAMRRWADEGRRRVLVEYVLIPGVNDRLEHADALARWLEPVPSTVNVIPYNPRRDSPWPAPDEATVNAFVARLGERGQRVRRRGTHGRGVMAACGQLGNELIRKRKRVGRSYQLSAISSQPGGAEGRS